MEETQKILIQMGFVCLNTNVWKSDWFGAFILLPNATPSDLAQFIYNRDRYRYGESKDKEIDFQKRGFDFLYSQAKQEITDLKAEIERFMPTQ